MDQQPAAHGDHPIQGLMKTAMESIKAMTDVSTVIGEPVETHDGGMIIPVSRVSVGFVAGGGEYQAARQGTTDLPFGGGSGAGVSVRPVGFLVVHKDQIRLLPVDTNTAVDRLLDMFPDLVDRAQTWWRARREEAPAEGARA